MKKFVTITALFLWLGMALIPVANAATGTIEKDCNGVRFFGTVAEGEQVRLEVRLHATSDWQSLRVQDDVIVITQSGPFDVVVPWVENPDGKLHRVAVSASGDGGS